MSTPTKDVFENKTKNECLALIKAELKKPNVFGHKGRFVTYSGPFDEFPDFKLGIPHPPIIYNKERAADIVAGWKNAIWLDESPIGKFLFVENNIYKQLQKKYAPNGEPDKLVEANAAIDEIMFFVSQEYI